jgi:hypothetical protein
MPLCVLSTLVDPKIRSSPPVPSAPAEIQTGCVFFGGVLQRKIEFQNADVPLDPRLGDLVSGSKGRSLSTDRWLPGFWMSITACARDWPPGPHRFLGTAQNRFVAMLFIY